MNTLGASKGAKVEARRLTWGRTPGVDGEMVLSAVGSSRESTAFLEALAKHPAFRASIEAHRRAGKLAGFIPSGLAPMSKEYATWATNNVQAFRDGTYFAVSYNTKMGTAKLFPGLGSHFRDSTPVPDGYQLPIRLKSHLVFETEVLGEPVSPIQRFISPLGYERRGGGVFFKGGELVPSYKSSILNGKYSVYGYAKLAPGHRPGFWAAVANATGLAVRADDGGLVQPAT